jgi:outer membrane immunogenic protein
MKKTTYIGLLTMLISNAAQAADIGDRFYTKAATENSLTAYDWSGWYVGAHAGFDWGRSRVSDNGVLTEPSVPMDGAIGGLLAGVNWKHDALIFGLEADISASGLRGHGTVPAIVVPNQYDVNLSGNVRGRLGFAVVPRTMLFVAAGVALANFEFRENSGPNSVKSALSGWTAGAGVDQAFTNNIIGRFEYLYADYGNKNFSVSPANVYNIGFRAQTARGALIWKF